MESRTPKCCPIDVATDGSCVFLVAPSRRGARRRQGQNQLALGNV